MAKKDTEKQIAAMEKLGFSKEEIADILKSDAEIDRGAKLFELDPEKEKVAKEARHCGTRKTPTVYKLDNTDGKRSKKKNTVKAEIIEKLFEFLSNQADFQNLEVANAERMITFSIGDTNFDLTLIQKRNK